MAFVMSDVGGVNQKVLVEAEGVNKNYKTKREIIHVLKEAGLKVFSGEVLGIVGASGVGKSTLLHVLGGLDKPEDGKVLFKGKNINHKKSCIEKIESGIPKLSPPEALKKKYKGSKINDHIYSLSTSFIFLSKSILLLKTLNIFSKNYYYFHIEGTKL